MPHRRDALGTVLGLATFLGGIALLLITFNLAYSMFSVPPNKALPLNKEGALDIGLAGSTVTGMVFRVFLLIVMALVSSLIAGRGVHMYTESRGKAIVTKDRVEVRKTDAETPA